MEGFHFIATIFQSGAGRLASGGMLNGARLTLVVICFCFELMRLSFQNKWFPHSRLDRFADLLLLFFLSHTTLGFARRPVLETPYFHLLRAQHYKYSYIRKAWLLLLCLKDTKSVRISGLGLSNSHGVLLLRLLLVEIELFQLRSCVVQYDILEGHYF